MRVARGASGGVACRWYGHPSWRTSCGSAPAAGPLGNLPSAPRSARTAARYAAKQKGGTGMAIAALVVLGLVCVVLVGVLIYVLGNL